MKRINADYFISRILAVGVFLVIVIMLPSTTSDPVNLPKLVAVGSISFCLLFISVKSYGFKIQNDGHLNKLLLLFIFGLIFCTAFSDAPISKSIWGDSGRNTGALTYLAFAILVFVSSNFRTQGSFLRVIKWILISGVIVGSYNAIVIVTGNDPMPWFNPYSGILGTFGNPNFNGAFLSIIGGLLLCIILDSTKDSRVRMGAVIGLLITLWEIRYTHALQGLLVILLSSGLIVIYWLKYRSKRLYVLSGLLAIFATLVTILGMLQIGPLANVVYKQSVSIRGQYWIAAFNMFKENIFFGTGLDNYGDWYRRSRSAQALVMPGADTISNAAHNVFLDILSGGGLVLGIPYLFLLLFTFHRGIQTLRRLEQFDYVFISIFLAWIAYQTQSMFSINQIGLGVIGWVMTGLVWAYSNYVSETSKDVIDSPKARTSKKSKNLNPVMPASLLMLAIFGFVIGLLFSLPPFQAAVKWRQDIASGDIYRLQVGTLRFPEDSARFLESAKILSSNGQGDLALKITQQALQFNRDDYNSWKIIYKLSISSSEKSKALKNLRRLDPLNPEFK